MDSLTLKVDSVELDFNDRKILRGAHLNCQQGEVTGLLGRNGSGKSSLLRIIFGTLTPTFRYVSINGEFIKKGYLQNRIAYLPQQSYLPYHICIHDLAKMMIDEKYWETFSALSIYQHHAKKAVGQLSGGEQRQLETLMIIYNRADFILLDEPFTHISPIQAEEFKQHIRNAAQTKGIIITDHLYRNVIDISDQLILLNNGYTQYISSKEDLVTYGYLSDTV
jgi:ABC-type multidrug transport system ATPase subunit